MTDPRLRPRRRALWAVVGVASIAFIVNFGLTLTADSQSMFIGHVLVGLVTGYIFMMSLVLLYWISDD